MILKAVLAQKYNLLFRVFISTGTAEGYQVENAEKVATLNIGGAAANNIRFIIGK
ncbi:MAG: hypothetical protein ABII88_08340 [Candidatus Omnitrophota bacterium]